MITIDDIRDAQTFLRGKIHRTPLFSSHLLGRVTTPQTQLWLKAENLQKTGSFKPRGVLYKLSRLTPDERRRGLITVSAGNTAQSLAWAAALEGIPCTVVVPNAAPKAKTDAATAYGAEVVRYGASHVESWEMGHKLIAERGLTLVHPYDDELVIAGHGTIGLEILEDLPEVQVVLVPVGGGAISTGIALAVKSLRPDVRVIGVEPALATKMSEALAAGHPVEIPPSTSIADGLRAPHVGEINLALAQQYLDAVVQVSDPAIACAVGLLAQRTKLVVEPSGAATVGALLEGVADIPAGAVTVSVLSGGNIDRTKLAEILTMPKPANHP
jgi:threonine dehydratase